MRKIFLCLVVLGAATKAMSQLESLKAFPLSSVRLLQSPFEQAQATDLKYILALDPDRLLAPFLKEAGLDSSIAGYGNWEGTGLNGHIGGHYLSALSDMYAATGNTEILRRLNYMIDKLEACQKRNGDGYVGGIPGGKAMWLDIAAGKIDAGSFSLNNKWVPLYNIHKLYAGLADAYSIAGVTKAKDILVGLSDWFIHLTDSLSDDQIQNMLRSEHGGLNEVFANVFAITGNKKYILMARRLSHRNILSSLLRRKDSLTGLHANTQIPKVIGFMQIASLSGDTAWARAAEFFWQTVTHNRTVSIGGNSVREHFNPSENFSSMIESREGPETCNTYNMLKLSGKLFLSKPSAEFINYYERALYNHILSSQHPKGGFVYFTPMRPRHYRVYSQPEQGFWCCVGSGMENHGKYGEMIYSYSGNDLIINLFIPSSLDWKERGIRLVQKTKFPYEERSTLNLSIQHPAKFAIYIRYPGWVKKGTMQVKVNQKDEKLSVDRNSYVRIERVWKTGDVISVFLPMQTTAEYLPDKSPWVSFVHGPVVLGAVTDSTGLVGLRADDSRMGHIANGPLYPLDEAPLLLTSKGDIESGITRVKAKPLAFRIADLVYPSVYKNVELVPFFQIHDARYMVYWRVTDSSGLEKMQQAIKERESARLLLESLTVDEVAPGEQQPESDHDFRGAETESGIFMERRWRTARGWFSYDLKNKTQAATKLRVTYFGADRNRIFDIYVNDILLQTVKLDGSGGEKFIDIEYALPEELLKQEILSVKFAAHPGSIAGGIYYLRLMK